MPLDYRVREERDGTKRFVVPLFLRWRDLDAYGHVNNATMLTLLEESRVHAFWMRPDGRPDPDRPLAIVPTGSDAALQTLIANTTIEYIAQLEYSMEPVEIELWVSRLGAASAEVTYTVSGRSGTEPMQRCAIARSTIVFFDTTTNRPRRLSDAERAHWEPFLGETLPMRAERRG